MIPAPPRPLSEPPRPMPNQARPCLPVRPRCPTTSQSSVDSSPPLPATGQSADTLPCLAAHVTPSSQPRPVPRPSAARSSQVPRANWRSIAPNGRGLPPSPGSPRRLTSRTRRPAGAGQPSAGLRPSPLPGRGSAAHSAPPKDPATPAAEPCLSYSAPPCPHPSGPTTPYAPAGESTPIRRPWAIWPDLASLHTLRHGRGHDGSEKRSTGQKSLKRSS